MENLLIATTPLQAKIAMHIQNEYVGENFTTLYVTPVMNERHQYYSKDFTAVYCLEKQEDMDAIVEKFSGDYSKIFYASFDHPLVLDLVACSTYKQLMSFDDGYADIFPYGMYSLPLIERQIGKYGITRDDLIKKTEKHYTLYECPYHVVSKNKLVYLDNFFETKEKPIKNGKTVKVLLGQNFSETDDAISVRFITTYAHALKIDYYIPHPKERFHIEGVQYFNSPYIFEDLIAELWKEYEFIEVYHFTSSVCLHLKGMSHVRLKGISIPYYEQRQNELRKLGCEFIHVPLGW